MILIIFHPKYFVVEKFIPYISIALFSKANIPIPEQNHKKQNPGLFTKWQFFLKKFCRTFN
mgnify:CR=1 FL=1